ncbi:pentapeptide repeat-containing protein [Myxosarcina sp. GI1(2024)]
MKLSIRTAIAALFTAALSLPTQAENLSHLNQLLSTKECPQCDLSSSGLVMANLAGAQLQGANLVRANLSQANLIGADLSGANLTGASLNGANLTGANLTGANLVGTDLRHAYLTQTNLTGVDLNTAYLDSAKGLAATAATPEQFHRWGVREAELGNYEAAIAHYQKAITLDPEFAPAYLGLGLIQYQFDNETAARENAKIAAKLFEAQEHELGYRTVQNFQRKMDFIRQAEQNASERERGATNFGKFVGGVGSLLLRLLL